MLFSCATELYLPTKAIEKIPLEDLKKGRILYVNNCGSCHKLELPNKYTDTQWKANLNEMQPKAAITNAEKQLIFDYLVNAPKKK